MLRSSVLKVSSLSGIRRSCSSVSQVPFNLEGMKASQNQKSIDRSRDTSHERLGPPNNQDSSVYDLDGNTNLMNVIQNLVPEPFVAQGSNLGDLKEGIPNGLSDAPMDRSSQLWTMSDRLNNT